ncbi:MAG: hypothetical protein KDI09_21050 [Halioglobus sp.]|nr:hypothetical protein [Halioglobus sp.]
MTVLFAITAVFTLIALLFLGRTVHCTRRGQLLRAGSSCLSGLLSAAIASVALLLTYSYYSYERLTSEQKIASIQFRATAPDTYQARLMIAGTADRSFELRGNEWQIDARLINWKPPLTILGLDPIYRLERLSGRYSAIDREQSESRTVHELSGSSPADLWQLARRYPLLLPGVDAYYGTATYVPMADGARYDISLSRDALIARPANSAAARALGNWRSASDGHGDKEIMYKLMSTPGPATAILATMPRPNRSR